MNQLQTQANFLTPQSLQDAIQIADILAKSDFVPKDFQNKSGNILVALQWGAEIGLQPLQALQNIAIINGRPAIWGDAMLALVRQSGLLVAIKEEQTDKMATCTVQRKGEEPYTTTFTMEDAKRAGLANRNTWSAYPKRMMQMRARAYALRDVFPDVLKGMAIAEEEKDKEIDVTLEIVQSEQPKANSGAKALKERLKSKVVETQTDVVSIDLSQYYTAIANAENLEQLKVIAGNISELELTEDAKNELRNAYTQRKEQLSVNVQSVIDELEHTDNVEQLNHILATQFEPFTNQMTEQQIAEVTAVYERKTAELTE